MHPLAEKIIKTLDYHVKKWLIKFRGLIYSLDKKSLTQPIFIIGCSRVGTTLVYKTFSKSRHLGSLNKETHGFWVNLHPLAERNWESHAINPAWANEQDKNVVSRYFYTLTGKQRIVDKNNQNSLSIPYLYRLFPDAHFVYVKRNPGDTIDSLINGWGKADEFGTWSEKLPVKIAIEHGKYRRWCFFLTQGWEELSKATIQEVCAFQYQTINEAILSAKQLIPSGQWHEISYETLIEAPVDEFKKVFTACHVPFDDAMTTHCQSVLDTPYNTFSAIGVGKWKNSHNKEKISSVLPLIADVSHKMGY
ncbi:MAG: sulfotransferase family protein [Gammaproteobacteria bacterium HGW-Gammaproteobacteria-3]|nr:MAG: sulfotransferase family protein [Gammaproteobacteria bacterium HGW-Gammaproteobacteria-3]